MVSFREARPDSPSAHVLLEEYFRFREATFPHAQGYQRTFPRTEHFTPPVGVFVVAEGANLSGESDDVGCGGVRRIDADATDAIRFEIKHLWVRPHMRGRGLGRMLLSELERRAEELGATEIVLDTNASLDAAGSLYASSGYEAIAPYNDNPNATNWYRKRVTTA